MRLPGTGWRWTWLWSIPLTLAPGMDQGHGRSPGELLALQRRLHQAGFEVVKTENLYTFDGQPGYAAVHG